MKDEIIYQHRDGEAGARKMLAYSGGVLYALDHRHGTKVDFPASRWKLAEIGLSCIIAALTR
jgi:hypothetical protein